MAAKNYILRLQALNCDISPDLHIKIASYADWVLFTDIFITGEYDRAIEVAFQAFEKSGRQIMRVLDIGANVGYFSLRFAHLFHKRFGDKKSFLIDMFEGSPGTYSTLMQRVNASQMLARNSQVHFGLVGQRTGHAKIYQISYHGMNSLVPRRFTKSDQVDFLNVEKIVDQGPIDFLKCDIEGSEESFIENYPELCNRLQTAVIEMHHTYCNTEKCYDSLRSSGLAVSFITPERNGTTVDLFTKLAN